MKLRRWMAAMLSVCLLSGGVTVRAEEAPATLESVVTLEDIDVTVWTEVVPSTVTLESRVTLEDDGDTVRVDWEVVPATPESLVTQENFDAARYGADYPDVVAVFGNDPAMLWQHYDTVGRSEGRIAYTTSEEINRIIDQIIQQMSLTDEEARRRLYALQGEYPEGRHWDNGDQYTRGWSTGRGCAGFAYIALDAVFGKDAVTTIDRNLDWSSLRTGDHIRMYNGMGGEHSVVLLSVSDNSVTVAEGNYNRSIHWNRVIPRSTLEKNFIYRETGYR